jgi:hypothetical protein
VENNSEEHLSMIEDCEQRESKLTEWEAGFLDSIRGWIEQDKRLSAKQADTLDKIWERVTSEG